MIGFTHINQQGHAKMVDVSDKQITKRTTAAHSGITVNEAIYRQISNNTNIRGNVLNTAQIAGTMAAKDTSTIIPMCHPLPLTGIDVHLSWGETDAPLYTLNIQVAVSTTDKVDVKMETLTAASAATLTIYDITKAVDKGTVTGETCLGGRFGGKSEDFQRQLDQ